MNFLLRELNIGSMSKIENKVIKELRMLADMTYGKQEAYYRRLLTDAVPVTIAPLSEVFRPEEIELIKICINPQPKECFKNATKLLDLFIDHDIKYVEGKYSVCGTFSTEHAWNKVDGKYVDITSELALGNAITVEDYAVLGEYDEREVIEYCIEYKVYGGIYNQKIEKEL